MNTFGWVAWMLLSIPGAILFIAAICDAVRDFRWKLAIKRGEIKPHPFGEREKARYLSAPRMP